MKPESEISNLTQTDIQLLPSLPLSCRATFPKKAPVIYFAISEAGQILYIGRSVDFNNRWKNHHRLNNLEEFTNVRIAWMEVSDRTLLPDAENILIDHFKPPLNGFNVVVRSESPTKKWVAKKETFNFPADEIQDLELVAKQVGRTKTDIVREATRRYVRELKQNLENE